MKRIRTRTTGLVPPTELAGMDNYDLAAVNGKGYDASNPYNWPEHLRAVARENWDGGPEAFDRWVALYPDPQQSRLQADE